MKSTFPDCKPLVALMILVAVLIFQSCATSVLNMVGDMLTAEGSNLVFTGDNDPQLVGDALPFAIKFYEKILSGTPGHQGLIRTTGSLYIMYANAFVAGPADYLPIDRTDEKLAAGRRAANLYIRGRDMLINGLDQAYSGFADAMFNDMPKAILEKMKKPDVASLYWIAAGWFGAMSQDSMNISLSMRLGNALACLDTAYKLDPDYQQGALDELYIQIYSSLPTALGGSRDKAEKHYQRALQLANGNSASVFVGWASTVLVNEQKKEEFVKILQRALEVDVDKDINRRLVNVMAQERARWYLKNLGDFFPEAVAN